jgi:hypothetical protein
MTQGEDCVGQAGPGDSGMVTLQVQIRAEHAQRLRALAAREGATPAALAALLLEEKLDEANVS